MLWTQIGNCIFAQLFLVSQVECLLSVTQQIKLLVSNFSKKSSAIPLLSTLKFSFQNVPLFCSNDWCLQDTYVIHKAYFQKSTICAEWIAMNCNYRHNVDVTSWSCDVTFMETGVCRHQKSPIIRLILHATCKCVTLVCWNADASKHNDYFYQCSDNLKTI